MEELQLKNEELQRQIECMKNKLNEAYKNIAQLKKALNRQYRYNQDYIPYPDEDERR
jgi:peptidoglycan hydrolase CwlO-like protein